MKSVAVILGAGAITPLGLHALSTALAHRAGMAAMREAPLCDPDGQPITMCFLPTLPASITAGARALTLGVRALDEAADTLGPAARSLRAEVVVAVGDGLTTPQPDGDIPAAALLAGLTTRARERFAEASVHTVARGAAAPAYALGPASEALAAGTVDVVLLGGVHTDFDATRIAALAAAGRLYTNDNLDALIPGEAAAFVVLARRDLARHLRLPVRAEVIAAGTAETPARPDNDAPAMAAPGLTIAIRNGLAPLADAGLRAGWVLTDLTFEVFRHLELSAAITRSQRFLCEPQRVEAPAQRTGYLGAAAMPVHLMLMCEGWRRGFAPHALAVSLAGSDTGERAVMLVASPAAV